MNSGQLQKKDYEYTPLYYGTPCQIRFYESTNNTYHGGIAYHDFVICGCSGAVLLIEDIIKDAEKFSIHWDDAIIELEWIDIEKEIRGE